MSAAFTVEVSRHASQPGQVRAVWELGVRDERGVYVAPVTTAKSLAAAVRRARAIVEARRGLPPGSFTVVAVPLDISAELLEQARAAGRPVSFRGPRSALYGAAVAQRQAVLAELAELGWSSADMAVVLGVSASRVTQVRRSAEHHAQAGKPS